MRDCIPEPTLQAWFDGELPADAAANVTGHLNLCLQCAEAARTVEEENQTLSAALAAEFAAPIPTERLRQRVETAVAAIHHPSTPTFSPSRWRISELFVSFRSIAYASVAAMILIAGFVGFVYLKKERVPVSVVKNDSPGNAAVMPKQPVEEPPMAAVPPKTATVHPLKVMKRTRASEPDARSLSWQTSQYDYAIAKLKEAIKVQPPMRPALRVEYEYNMAVIDDTLATSRDAARRNPTDPQAAQVMLAAYQSKVDLMNQIANARVSEK
jgi:hypothetical protein